MLLTDKETAVKIAKNMRWKGKHPVVTLVTRIYEQGVKLTKKRNGQLRESYQTNGRLGGLVRRDYSM
jgi:hypothetical protein